MHTAYIHIHNLHIYVVKRRALNRIGLNFGPRKKQKQKNSLRMAKNHHKMQMMKKNRAEKVGLQTQTKLKIFVLT